jgi:glycosyltransferase involved in cell wall biosynthesis
LKSRLLILTNRLVVGGISNDIIPLAYYLQAEFDILILYGEKEKDEANADFLIKNYPGLQLKKIAYFKKNINPVADIAAYFQLKKHIKKFKADIVHTHGAKSGFLGRLAAYRCRVPYIIHTFHGHHFHSYYNNFISSALLRFERKLARVTTLIIAISKWQKKELTEIYKIVPEEKVRTITIGIETGQNKTDPVMQRCVFRKKYNIDDYTIAIGIAGRIVPIKNLMLFVKVAGDLISATEKKVCFFIIGDGYLKNQIKAQCAALNLSFTENAGVKANIIFTSWIEDIIPAMRAMDIVALTSYNEGTPLSLIEAQWCCKPVVATNVGGVKDIVLNNETGFLVNSDDKTAMVEKLKLLAENDELRNTMGSRATTYAAEKFSKQKEVEAYKKLYKSLISSDDDKQLVHHQSTIQ